jgi:hypothetical protein
MELFIMEQNKKMIPAINALPTNNPLAAQKILMDRMMLGNSIVTEEKKSNLTPLLS